MARTDPPRTVRASRQRAHAAALLYLSDRRAAVALAAEAVEAVGGDAALVEEARVTARVGAPDALESMYPRLLRARSRLDPPGRGPRLVALVAVAVALSSLGAWLTRATPIRATTPATLADSDYFGAARAIDGDPATYWSGPDRVLGQLGVDFEPAARARELRVLTPPSRDRGGVRGRVVIRFADGSRQRAPLSLAPGDELIVPLEGEAVRRVWLEVRPARGAHSAGIAEVELR